MESSDTTQQGKGGRGEKYSLTAYLVALFAVVIALVMLSYFVNSRDSGRRVEDLQQHSDRVLELEEKITALEERVSALEGVLDEYKAIEKQEGDMKNA